MILYYFNRVLVLCPHLKKKKKQKTISFSFALLPNFQHFKICQLAETIDVKEENITSAFYVIIYYCSFFQLKTVFLACSSCFWRHASVVSNSDVILTCSLPSTHIQCIYMKINVYSVFDYTEMPKFWVIFPE